MIMKNKYCMYSVWEKLLFKSHGDVTVAILEFWKVDHVSKSFLVKHNSIFGLGYYNRKKRYFSFYWRFIFNIFF